MSKIEQMAKEYCQGSSFDDACMMKPAYIAGANAVLREIEELLNPEWKLGSLLEDTLRNKICELKGE